MDEQIEMMGFEKDKRLRRDFKNQPVDVVLDGRTFYFESLFEYRWAQYLIFLQQVGEIIAWEYEPGNPLLTAPFWKPSGPTFRFPDGTGYTIDFGTVTIDYEFVYYECMALFEARYNTRFRKVQEHYPGTKVCLVVERRPKKKLAQKYAIAEKYTERIIEAYKIWPGVPNLDKGNPGQTAQTRRK